MLYFANTCSNKRILDLMRSGTIGAIATPLQRNKLNGALFWCADNSCFSSRYPGDDAFISWLSVMQPLSGNCKFATAPDIVGDASATLRRSRPFLPQIRALGYPAAFVAQDGLEKLTIPFGEFDVLFIGGSTEWKLGHAAREIAAEANAHGKWVHMGRVNSYKRLQYADDIGCSSSDGTFLTFAPDTNVPRMLRWFEKLEGRPAQTRLPEPGEFVTTRGITRQRRFTGGQSR